MSRKFKKIKRKNFGSYPYFTVVLSITLALFGTGLFFLLIVHANKLSSIVQDKFEVHAYLDKDIEDTDVNSLKKSVAKFPFVQHKNGYPQIRYISKDEAAKKFIKDTGEDFYKVLGDNPLRASFAIKIDQRYANTESLKKIKVDLSRLHGIFEVDYRENLIEQINRNIQNISFILIFFSLILIVISILLINNTIRLALYSQRFLIRSMQLVGAKKWFIQKPFLLRALLQGVISACIAILILFVITNYLYAQIPELRQLADPGSLISIFAGLLFFGIFIAFFSSWMAISKYLKMSLDELY